MLDHLGRKVLFDEIPQRIISLVPSITETLFDIGAGSKVVGRTKFCIHPSPQIKEVARVGGTKNIDIEKVRGLKPDLILANKEENNKEMIEALEQAFPVFVTYIKTVDDGVELISLLGDLSGNSTKANDIKYKVELSRSSFQRPLKQKVIYLIWQNPYLTIGSDTFIHHMLEEAGFENLYADETRYPVIKLEDRIAEADLIMLSSEPFPFKRKHALELETTFQKKVVLVDGEMFSWYGSRMIKAWEYFRDIQIL